MTATSTVATAIDVSSALIGAAPVATPIAGAEIAAIPSPFSQAAADPRGGVVICGRASGDRAYRVGYTATSTKTVEFWGENEYVWTVGGTFGWRLIAEVLFNVTNSTGTRAGTKIVTITSPGAYNSPVEVGTSGGRDPVTC